MVVFPNFLDGCAFSMATANETVAATATKTTTATVSDGLSLPVVPPLDWRSAEIHLEVAFDGRVRTFRIHGAFARMGSGDRCEIRIPNLGSPVSAYIQVGNGYLAVIEVSSSVELPRCEIQYLLPGGSVWLLPNARLTLESLRLDQVAPESFSWESYDMEDLRVLPNTLALESVTSKSERRERDNHFRLTSALSVLGTHPACHLQLKHRSVAPFQCVIYRGEHVGQPVRVVDLHAPSPTQVGSRIANGDILNVGSRLVCGKLVFTARRMLYGSPNAFMSSLPGMENLRNRATDDGMLQPEIVLQDGLPAIETPSTPNIPGQSSEKTSMPSAASFNAAAAVSHEGGMVEATFAFTKGSRPSGVGSSDVGRTHVGTSIHSELRPDSLPSEDVANNQLVITLPSVWEENMERNQAEMLTSIQAMVSRMDAMEQSLVAIPKLLDRLPKLLQDSLADSSNRSNDRVLEAIHEIKRIAKGIPNASNKENDGTSLSPQHKPAEKIAAVPQPVPKSWGGKKRASQTGHDENGLANDGHRTSESKEVSRANDVLKIPRPDRPSTISHAADVVTRKPLGSVARSQSEINPNIDSKDKRLAASDSPGETLLLGSLVRLRQKKEDSSQFRFWFIMAIAAFLLMIFLPMAWMLIPEGWRNLLWDTLTPWSNQGD